MNHSLSMHVFLLQCLPFTHIEQTGRHFDYPHQAFSDRTLFDVPAVLPALGFLTFTWSLLFTHWKPPSGAPRANKSLLEDFLPFGRGQAAP